jgi:hypothetical protein
MKLFVAIYDDARLFNHFLNHYVKAGVTEFFIALDEQVAGLTAPSTPSCRITLVHGLDVADSFHGGNAAVTEMRQRHQDPDEWAIIVDLDEFIEFPGPIPELLQAADRQNANVIKGTMFDRFSIDGKLVDFAPESDLSRLYPVKARFVYNVLDGADYKGVVVKGLLEPRIAHHEFVDERAYPEFLEISHYKWSSTHALDRVKLAYDTLRARGAHWADEYRLILEHYERHGRFAWETFGGSLAEPTGLKHR